MPRKLGDDLEGSGGAISFYDFLMLRTLYCEGIRPGDDKNRVARFLVNEKECLMNLFAKGE